MTNMKSRDSKQNAEAAHKKSHDPAPLSARESDADDLTEDQETIFFETGHLANRDDMALNGHTIVQGGSTADTDDSWGFDRKDKLRGDSDYSSDSVDAQLAAVGQITEEILDPSTHHDPTPAIPQDHRNEFDRFSDQDLLRMADVLGIPDRTNLLRPQLIERIRHYEMRGF